MSINAVATLFVVHNVLQYAPLLQIGLKQKLLQPYLIILLTGQNVVMTTTRVETALTSIAKMYIVVIITKGINRHQ